MASVRVAAVQGCSTLGDTERNADHFSHLCAEAAAAGAKFLVLPEAALTGYMSEDFCQSWHVRGRPLNKSQVSGVAFDPFDPNLCAETVPGPLVDRFCMLAKELNAYISIPFVERAEVAGLECFYNTVCLASPSGELVAHYRKNNPWPYVDHAWMTPGTDMAIAETPFGRVGLAVCFDVHVMFRRYANHGDLWTLLYSIAWVDSNTPAWFGSHLPLRVAEAEFNVVAANWAIPNEDVANRWRAKSVDGYGHSSVYNCAGRRLACSAKAIGDDIVYADLPVCMKLRSLASIEKERVLAGHWSSDFYGPLEHQELRVTETGLRAVKITGDANVPAGMTTWWTSSIPAVGDRVPAFFCHRDDPKNQIGFRWERAELHVSSENELHLKLLEGGRLRGMQGIFCRVEFSMAERRIV